MIIMTAIGPPVAGKNPGENDVHDAKREYAAKTEIGKRFLALFGAAGEGEINAM
jgi:hypothetical protein